MTIDGRRPALADPTLYREVTWSRDGGKDDIYTVNVDGSDLRRLTGDGSSNIHPG